MQQAGAASGESKAVALDPISEAQDLVPRIKQSLVDLVKVACETLLIRTALEGTNERMEGVTISGQFDRRLEEFYSVCDELQVCLTTALDAVIQSRESAETYKIAETPMSTDTQTPKTHQTPTLTYDQCLAAAEKRAAEVKELHDMLQEFSRSLET